ncbi:MAG: phytoene synthase, partial [Pseudomonadota bacterium]
IAAYLAALPGLAALDRRALPGTEAEEEVAALAAEGLARLAAAQGPVPAAARPALRAAWTARARLTRAATDPGAALRGELEPSEFRRRAGLLARWALGRV